MLGLLQKRLLFVTGKGGVGKTTISAALALKAVREGKRVLLCEVRTQGQAGVLLQRAPLGPTLVEMEKGLYGVNIDPQEGFREYALMKLRFQALYRAVFENRLMRYALRAIPSIAEIVTLGKIVYHVGEVGPGGGPLYDLVIVDAPSTGHALTLLKTPQVILDAVPAGPMASEMEHMRKTVADRALTGLVIVAIPEEMPVVEALELNGRLAAEVDVERSAMVLNGDVPLRFSPIDLEAIAGSPELAACARAAVAYQRMSDQAQAHFERLRREAPLPTARIPFRFTRTLGRADLDDMSHELAVIA